MLISPHFSRKLPRQLGLFLFPLTIWLFLAQVALKQPSGDLQRPKPAPSPKLPHRHVKENCRRAEWRLGPKQNLQPVWQVNAQRAVTIPAAERAFAEHLEGASCRFYRFLQKPHLLKVLSPAATYHYTSKRLRAQRVQWSLFPLASAGETDLNTERQSLSSGLCGELSAQFSRSAPTFEALDFQVEWSSPPSRENGQTQ